MTTGETPGATPAESIHMVPFQFDLMKLLPRCQQIELFFYTFSKGTAAMSLHTVMLLMTLGEAFPQKICLQKCLAKEFLSSINVKDLI